MTAKWLKREPYSYRYRYPVVEAEAGQSLIQLMSTRFTFRSMDYWLDLIDRGLISVNEQGQSPDYILVEGDIIHTERPDVTEPDVNANIQIVHEKDGALILNKPAPIPVHPSGRFYKNSLTYILKEQFGYEKLHTLHRLDHMTTGVLCFATDSDVARQMHLQFEKKSVRKAYAVIVTGNLGDKPFEVNQPIGRVEGVLRGCGLDVDGAKESLTKFWPIAKSKDLQLLLAEPVTGRTNQIRVHAQYAGACVWQDPLYSDDPDDTVTQMGLHCLAMKFNKRYLDLDQTEFYADVPEHYHELFSENDLNQLKETVTDLWSESYD